MSANMYVRYTGDADGLRAIGIHNADAHAAILGKVGRRGARTFRCADASECVRVAFDGLEHAYVFALSELEAAADPAEEKN
jgi:hypothetical protein